VIPSRAITQWSFDHPWPNPDQVEQDLLLSRAICVIAADDYLGRELVFRGGTALHKLHLSRALRYSEDLDYVRCSTGGIGQVSGRLTDLGRDLGFVVKTRITEHPKVFWRTTANNGLPLRLKIEINTHERTSALPLMHQRMAVVSSWWVGEAAVQTFQPAELVATKIRALYQRSKGRDLFDLWLALTQMDLDPDEILQAFSSYRPERLTAKQAVANLRSKSSDEEFRRDIDRLVAVPPGDYSVDVATELVIDKLLARL